MWCACCKATAIEDHRETPKLKQGVAVPPVEEVRSVDVVREDVKVVQQGNGAIRLSAQDLEKGRQRQQERRQNQPRLSRDVPRGMEGEQVAAGWPAWLASVAGEAIRGWVPRRADSFEKLDKIGQGTYSNVYRARDLDNGKVVALKKVRFDNLEPESVRFMAREIHILRRLNHPNIIKLEGLVTSRLSCSLYLVFEYMEHDLAGLASFPGHRFTEPQVKCYMQQLLQGLDHCHSHNILHRDIKGSNLLIDNKGILKIADFGLASFYDPEQNQPLTSRVVTLWYRPPELLLGATHYGVAVDLWSTGCILAELYAGKPIMPGRTEVEQLHKIFKLCGSPSEEYWRKSKLPHATIFKPQQPYERCLIETFKDFPAATLTLMDILLSIDPADRLTAASALKSEYFTTKPLSCDPSSLPRYPPSKEFDAKVREEEARRMAAASKVQRLELERKVPRLSKAIPAPDANAELASSLQKRQAQCTSRSRSEKFSQQHEEVASGFPIEPPKQVSGQELNGNCNGHYTNRSSHSGPLVNRNQRSKSWKHEDESPSISAVTRIPAPSGFNATRRINITDDGRERIFPQVEVAPTSGRLSESGNEHPNRKYDKGRAKDQVLQGYGSKGNNIHYSGPLMRPSGNVDQMLKEHDRHIQEVFRQSRLDKRVRRIQAEVSKAGTRPSDQSGAPIFPSSRGTPVFPSSRGAACIGTESTPIGTLPN